MTRPPLSKAAAIARYVGPRWLDPEVVLDEFICRRDWYPEDVYRGLSDAIETGLLVRAIDGAVKRPRRRP